MAECGVLCRYFFQQMLLEADDAQLEEFASSLLLSSRPTLAELRHKFPSRARTISVSRDLTDENRALPVSSNGKSTRRGDKTPAIHEDVVDVAEDRHFRAFFHWQNKPQSEGYPMPQPQTTQQDVGSVLFWCQEGARLQDEGSAMAQTLQKHSAQMWEKVTAATGVGGGAGNAPPTATTLAQLAKLIGALKAPLHPGNATTWTYSRGCGRPWNRLGFRHGDPMREMQFVLPLQCLVYFHEVRRTVALPILNDQSGPEAFSYALVGSQVAHVLADMLQLRDGGCLGSERPFWRMFEDPVAFFELFCIAFRAFASSWKLNSNNSYDVNFHLSYVGDFTQELLRRGPESVTSLVEHATSCRTGRPKRIYPAGPIKYAIYPH
ncbi:ELMO domain [Phytophthora cactorum]|nr:ELMO domain [Phytophthora cactorum]